MQSLEQSLLKILALLRLSISIEVFNNELKYSMKIDVMAKVMTFKFFRQHLMVSTKQQLLSIGRERRPFNYLVLHFHKSLFPNISQTVQSVID